MTSGQNARYDALLAQTNAAVDLIRDVAKWFIASIGAVASLLVAGIQLTSIGTVSWPRAVVAAVLVLVVIGAAGLAIVKLTAVLLPRITTRADVVEAAQRGEFGTFVAKHASLWADFDDAAALWRAQQAAVAAANADGAGASEADRARRLTDAVNLLVPFGSYFAVRAGFATAKRWTLGCALVGAAAVVGYARLVGSA